jgi:hypothetical protein
MAVVWWKVRDNLLLWLAVLFGAPVFLGAVWITLGFLFGF